MFVPNSLTVHPHSFSLNAVLAASSFCPARRIYFSSRFLYSNRYNTLTGHGWMTEKMKRDE
jgi:hypothetical protein